MGLVIIAEADILIPHYLDIFDHVDDVIYELSVLVGLDGQGASPGKSWFDVHIPEGPDEFFQGWLLPFLDSLSGLPDDITHKTGDINRIIGSALLEILYQPLFGLVVDELVIVADTGFA